MPLSIILLCLPAPPPSNCICSLVTTETAASWNDTPASDKNVMFSAQSLAALLSYYPPVRIKLSVLSKLASKNLQSEWSQMTGAAENGTVATETLLSCYRNIPLLVCLHTNTHTLTHSHAHTHTHTHTHWGALRWSFLCMKMEIMTKNITKNTTTSK